MRPNKSAERLLSDPSTDMETMPECDICGVTLGTVWPSSRAFNRTQNTKAMAICGRRRLTSAWRSAWIAVTPV